MLRSTSKIQIDHEADCEIRLTLICDFLPIKSTMATPVRNPYTTHWQYIRQFLNPWEQKCADMFVLERLVLALLCLVLLPTAATLIRYLGGLGGRELRKIVVEFYVVAKTILAVWVLWSNHWGTFWYWVAIYSLIELFLNLAAVVLLRDYWRRPMSWNRSLILAGFNFLEFTSWFAVLYLHTAGLKDHDTTVKDAATAFYFSVITASTVGYGDVTPNPGMGRILAIVQISLAICFITAVVAYFVSSLDSQRSSNPID